MDLKKFRKDFPILTKENKFIYFDNAASSLKPIQVIQKIDSYYNEFPVNIHRGLHHLSMQASIIYDDTRKKVSNFINCNPDEVVFTQNATDAINLLMYMLYNSNFFKKGDEIIISVYEHHSNLVPWQFLSNKLGLNLKVVDIDKNYNFDILDFQKKLTNKTKLVAIAHASNTIATISPINEIIELSHEKGALVLIDGSQSIPHFSFDFKKTGCDFLAFTCHKMLGPTGVGCLISKKEFLERFSPVRFGGDMIKSVSLEKSEWNNIPYKFEAGTPNISGIFGLGAAIDYLNMVGLDNIEKHDKELLEYGLENIQKVKEIELYNPLDINKQGPIILFSLGNNDPQKINILLDEISGIAVRSGMHCAQPIVSRLNPNGLLRASFYFYNTFEEIDVFIKTLKDIQKKFL